MNHEVVTTWPKVISHAHMALTHTSACLSRLLPTKQKGISLITVVWPDSDRQVHPW